jgi:hypothetical protein
MTRRLWILFGALIVSALPMVWLSIDPNAGDTLLRLTQPGTVRVQTARPLQGSVDRNALIEPVATHTLQG